MKVTRNSGIYQQDAVVGRLIADSRKPQQLNAIVKAGMAQAERNRIYREERAKTEVPRFVR
jgi:hypothetical protein